LFDRGILVARRIDGFRLHAGVNSQSQEDQEKAPVKSEHRIFFQHA
jgi:hypothetical protein